MKTWSTSGDNKIIQVLSGRSNVFLITKNQKNILVDTSPEFMWGTLKRRLHRLGVKQIELLILTHSHFDHAANAERIKEKYKAKVIMHETEVSYLTSGDNILPAGTNLFAKFLVKILAKQFQSITRYSPCTCNLTFDEYFDLTAFGINGYLLHTPGHTQGSTSVIIDDEIALVGDTMFGVFWWTIFPPFAADEALMVISWGRLLRTKCMYFLPSHGAAIRRSLAEKDYQKRKL